MIKQIITESYFKSNIAKHFVRQNEKFINLNINFGLFTKFWQVFTKYRQKESKLVFKILPQKVD